MFSIIDKNELKLKPLNQAKTVNLDKPATLTFEKEFPISANQLLEYITNYSYRKHWVKHVNDFEFKPCTCKFMRLLLCKNSGLSFFRVPKDPTKSLLLIKYSLEFALLPQIQHAIVVLSPMN